MPDEKAVTRKRLKRTVSLREAVGHRGKPIRIQFFPERIVVREKSTRKPLVFTYQSFADRVLKIFRQADLPL